LGWFAAKENGVGSKWVFGLISYHFAKMGGEMFTPRLWVPVWFEIASQNNQLFENGAYRKRAG
jgi:hypothetical protein